MLVIRSFEFQVCDALHLLQASLNIARHRLLYVLIPCTLFALLSLALFVEPWVYLPKARPVLGGIQHVRTVVNVAACVR
jgi:hypothetical protein